MRRVSAVLLALGLLGTGCASISQDSERTLHVYAAASLQGPFEEMAADFEQENPGVQVRLVLTGSADAVAQIRAGAPVDVVATADTTSMGALEADGLLADSAEAFATNTLQLVASSDVPTSADGWRTLAQANDGGDDLVVCAPVVPCGAATLALAEQEKVELRPVSEEQSVTDVLAKVTSGAADLGIVYRTDVLRAGDGVRGIELPGAGSVVNEYPIARLAEAQEAGLAAEFVGLVLSARGRDLLDAAGFGPP